MKAVRVEIFQTSRQVSLDYFPMKADIFNRQRKSGHVDHFWSDSISFEPAGHVLGRNAIIDSRCLWFKWRPTAADVAIASHQINIALVTLLLGYVSGAKKCGNERERIFV